MKTITMTYTNSKKQEKAVTLHIYCRSEKNAYRGAATIGTVSDRVSDADWDDEGFARVEKLAALEAGIKSGETFYWILA